jgi:hypothetical protein
MLAGQTGVKPMTIASNAPTALGRQQAEHASDGAENLLRLWSATPQRDGCDYSVEATGRSTDLGGGGAYTWFRGGRDHSDSD